MFASAIQMLVAPVIEKKNLPLIDTLLNSYVTMFQAMYGLRYMTINVHMLLHLVQLVKKYGPLWTTSCFPFEDVNGLLTRCLGGASNGVLKMVSAVMALSNVRTIPTVIKDPECLAYARDVLNLKSSHENSNAEKIDDDCWALKPFSQKDGRKVFSRIILNHIKIESLTYTRNKRRLNYLVRLKGSAYKFGMIHSYFVDDLNVPFAVIVPLVLKSYLSPYCKFIIEAETAPQIELSVDCIDGGPLMLIQCETKYFIVDMDKTREIS